MIRTATITTAFVTVGILTSMGYAALAQPSPSAPFPKEPTLDWPTTNQPATRPNQTRISSIDRDFMMRAAQGGIAEVELSRVAVERTTDNNVRQFARQMIQDHTQANSRLTQLAKQKGMSLPTQMDAEHRSVRAQLEQIPARSFDQAYMRVMVIDHQRTIDLFQSEARRGQDQDVKTFATSTLPTIQDHLRMVSSMMRNSAQPNQNSPRQTQPDSPPRRDGDMRDR